MTFEREWPGVSRRALLEAGTAAATLAVVARPATAWAANSSADEAAPDVPVALHVNGQPHALAMKPWRVPESEERLSGAQVGGKAGGAAFDAAADAALDGARGYGGNDFKIPLARRTLAAVLTQATQA